MPQEDFITSHQVFSSFKVRKALASVNPSSKKFELGQMADASEAFDEIMTWISLYIWENIKKKTATADFRNVVGFELEKKYKCVCGKYNGFPQDPNQFMLFAQVSHLTDNIWTDYYDVSQLLET